MFTKLPLFLFGCLLSIPLSNGIFAQNLDAVTISGKITDSNNLAIVGATVTATLTETGAERAAVTDGEGRYRIIELAPGSYHVKAAANGFGGKENQGLETIAGQSLQLDFTLAPADLQVETTVTVSDADAPAIDTTRIVVGGTVTEREIEDLPNNSRNPLDLIFTLGGVTEEPLSTRDLAEDNAANPRSTPTEQGAFSLSGGASYSNNITIDGLDNNDDRSAGDRFQPSLESIAEVQVITNQFSAEYGRASGGRVNLRTRAGTNKFRGRAFMFFRDDNLNANTWYNNSQNLPRLPLTEYNPGFTLGGPVIIPAFYNGKSRTFFFTAYEHNRLEDTTLIDTYLPVVPNPRFNLPPPTGTAQFCDHINVTTCENGMAGFISPYSVLYSTPNIVHSLTVRLDHRLSKSNDFTFGYQFGRKNNRRTRSDSTTRIEEALQARNSDTDAFNFTDNHIFSSKTVNQIRFQWSRFEPSYQTDNPLAPVVLIGYRNPVTHSAQTLTAGNSTASSLQNFAASRKETRIQLQNSLTYIVDDHTVKGGFDFQSVDSRAVSLGDATGTFNFSGVLNYSNNLLARYRQNFGTAVDVENIYWGVFINDEMRPRSNLTINYGFRYERETAVSDNNNLGPRLGIAWAPFRKGVVRFGTGIFYNRVLLRTVGDFIQNVSGSLISFDTNLIGTSGADARRVAVLAAIAQQFPNGFSSVDQLRNIITSTGNSPDLGFAGNTGSASNPLRMVDPNLKIPESYQFNIGFEREIAKGWVFETNYTWNKTAHLWREYNPNVPILPAGYADWTAYLLANPFVFVNSNGNIRTYSFYLGSTTDGSGTATSQGGATTCSTTAAQTCFVNLNSVNTATTFPSTAVTGVSNNAVGTPLGIALAAIARFRPDQTVQEKATVASIGNSAYQGLIFELRRRYRKLGYGFGSSFRAVYTLSWLKDDGLNNTSNAEINADFGREWARALQDRRHRFALSAVFDTPRWLGNLRLSPIFRFGSSAPFNLGYGIDRNLNDVSTDRMLFSGNLKDIKWRKPASPFPTALASQFSLQPIGSKSGNLPRNAGKGPKLFIFDLNVTREWKLGERLKLRPTVEIDNVFNLAVFSFGSEFIDFIGLSAAPTAAQLRNYQNFLVPTRTYRPRQIRLGVRFDF